MQGWRKIQLQEVLLLNAGHPLFADSLWRCLEEADWPMNEAIDPQHELEIERSRNFGHADRWYQAYVDADGFEEFQ